MPPLMVFAVNPYYGATLFVMLARIFILADDP